MLFHAVPCCAVSTLALLGQASRRSKAVLKEGLGREREREREIITNNGCI
jgi:hypothetical protein